MNYREARLFLTVAAILLALFFSSVGAVIVYKNLSEKVEAIK